MAAVKVMCSNSMRGVMEEILPQFEKSSGHKIAISYDPAKLMLKRIRSGETADLAIIGAGAIGELAKEGIVAPDTRVLARSSIGMAVRSGAPKPDISSIEAFKAAILNAQSVAYTIDGASGMHFADLIERLGIAEAVQAKARRQPGGLVGELVARGEAEIAIQQISELMAVRGVEVIGPIPQALQKTTVVAAGIFSTAPEADAARALLAFVSTPAAAEVIKAKGLESPGETPL
ncbi:MAG TPA: substrate-binding domain-containing protein [Burkholderiales bacterium]|nr:substrate-binding domain-containing protein [Burkholderiales bacterium]